MPDATHIRLIAAQFESTNTNPGVTETLALSVTNVWTPTGPITWTATTTQTNKYTYEVLGEWYKSFPAEPPVVMQAYPGAVNSYGPVVALLLPTVGGSVVTFTSGPASRWRSNITFEKEIFTLMPMLQAYKDEADLLDACLLERQNRLTELLALLPEGQQEPGEPIAQTIAAEVTVKPVSGTDDFLTAAALGTVFSLFKDVR